MVVYGKTGLADSLCSRRCDWRYISAPGNVLPGVGRKRSRKGRAEIDYTYIDLLVDKRDGKVGKLKGSTKGVPLHNMFGIHGKSSPRRVAVSDMQLLADICN